jgi:hypothetical protein
MNTGQFIFLLIFIGVTIYAVRDDKKQKQKKAEDELRARNESYRKGIK